MSGEIHPDRERVFPIILTLVLDDAAQAWFDALRRRYFPPERLVVGAHCTLFHALPGLREADIVRHAAACAAACAPLPVDVDGVRFLGRGAAFFLRVAGGAALRRDLATPFAAALSAQDRAGWRPHVTIQNKVSAEEARRTVAQLATLLPPAPIVARGVAVWRYLGGPWQHVASLPFSGENPG